MMEKRRVALVTGCSEPSSLGAGFCRELLRRGYRVFATARKVDTLKELATEGCDVLALDVADSQSITDAAETVKSTVGRLDLLINNAGIVTVAPLLDTDLKAVHNILQVNTISQLEMVQAFAKLLVNTANDPSLSGRETLVLNVGSSAAGGSPWHAVYGFSKAASHTLSQGLRMEMKPLGVNVVTGNFSLIATAMTANQKTLDSLKPGPSTFYPNWEEIHAGHVEGMGAFKKGSPSVESSVRDVLNQIDGKTNPPYVVYAGKGSGFTKYGAWIPQWVFDKLFNQIGRYDLIQRPGVSKADE